MAGQLKYWVTKGLRTARALFKNAWERKAFYLTQDFPAEVEKRAGGVFLHPLNLFLREGTFNFILDSYTIARNFSQHAKIRCEIQGENFFIYWNELKLNPTTAEEIFIIEEIFVSGTYNYRIGSPHVVVDVGMNVAMASLFFASLDKVIKVYGFEPFKPTYQQALINIQNNPALAQRIEPSPFGLSNKAEQLEVNYTYESKGQVGIHGTDLIRSSIKQHQKLKIDLLPATDALKKIYEQHPQERFVLKVDCEGAEYDIFEALSQQRLLDRVDIVFIEWHERGPEPLLEILAASNFKIFHQQSAGKKVGMIYGAR